MSKLRLVCISDTHGHHRSLDIPEGDVLVHAGDITSRGEQYVVDDFSEWLKELPHPHKVVIAGNHDFNVTHVRNCHFLMDSGVTIEGRNFYGAPWQPFFFDWAFNLSQPELKEKWALIPESTDVLVTHGPPYGTMDLTESGDHAGCDELKKAIARVKPQAHIFGHIHEGYGTEGIYVNASTCNTSYDPSNPPIVKDI